MSPASQDGENFAEVVVVRHEETSWNASRIIQLVFDQSLRERHMGDLHGLKFDDAVSTKPEAYKAFSSDDRNQEIPVGGESLDQLSKRCVSYLNMIADKHKGKQ
ncbi:phosphoglycerate mutase-like protein 4 [Setaria italica]|uniref:phosphoglycerate mutase-like protein 4 n=1 Tax=Setaria italica TaxID=4555 RepID=UPI0007199D29|nr:phosphoglycerate mutase-like protein 4 [Setaria italica]